MDTTDRTSGLLVAGKAILVTGGGSGIGRATALALARDGADVGVADMNLESARTVADEIRGLGRRACAIEVDVSVEPQVAAMVSATIEHLGRLDGAFNNAGIGTRAIAASGMKACELPLPSWQKMLDVNLTGVWLCMKYELAALAPRGSIVNNASIAGLVGLPTAGAYVAAKHGVVGLTKAAAIDYGPQGVRINAVCPGYVDTPLTRHGDESRMDGLRAKKPLGRLGEPEEIADAVVWLCSDRSSFATGTTIVLDGGYVAQ
jgi:NAD(P)-dependent dehydrogenase (short-subunit alcohol dehydrogenase family)